MKIEMNERAFARTSGRSVTYNRKNFLSVKRSRRRLPIRVNISGRGTGRARCLSDVACGLTAICCCARRSWIPARREGRSRSQRRIFVFGQGNQWASGTVRRLPDEDAIHPSPESGSRGTTSARAQRVKQKTDFEQEVTEILGFIRGAEAFERPPPNSTEISGAGSRTAPGHIQRIRIRDAAGSNSRGEF
jgi:hypothetical protein